MSMLFTSVLESLSCLPFPKSQLFTSFLESLSCLLVFWKPSVVYPLLPQLFASVLESLSCLLFVAVYKLESLSCLL